MFLYPRFEFCKLNIVFGSLISYRHSASFDNLNIFQQIIYDSSYVIHTQYTQLKMNFTFVRV